MTSIKDPLSHKEIIAMITLVIVPTFCISAGIITGILIFDKFIYDINLSMIIANNDFMFKIPHIAIQEWFVWTITIIIAILGFIYFHKSCVHK